MSFLSDCTFSVVFEIHTTLLSFSFLFSLELSVIVIITIDLSMRIYLF